MMGALTNPFTLSVAKGLIQAIKRFGFASARTEVYKFRRDDRQWHD